MANTTLRGEANGAMSLTVSSKFGELPEREGFSGVFVSAGESCLEIGSPVLEAVPGEEVAAMDASHDETSAPDSKELNVQFNRPRIRNATEFEAGSQRLPSSILTGGSLAGGDWETSMFGVSSSPSNAKLREKLLRVEFIRIPCRTCLPPQSACWKSLELRPLIAASKRPISTVATSYE